MTKDTSDEDYVCADASIRTLIGLMAGKQNDPQWQQVLEYIDGMLSYEIHNHIGRMHGNEGIFDIAAATELAKNDHALIGAKLDEAIALFPEKLSAVLETCIPALIRTAVTLTASVTLAPIDVAFNAAVERRDSDQKVRVKGIIRDVKRGSRAQDIRQKVVEIIGLFASSKPDKTRVAWKYYEEQRNFGEVEQPDRDKVLDRFNKLLLSNGLAYDEIEKEALEFLQSGDADRSKL